MKYLISTLLFLIILLNTGWSQKISLIGEWQFAIDSNNTLKVDNVSSTADWRTAKVPSSWQAQFSDLRDYQGIAWYRKEIELNENITDKKVLIHFEAVDYITAVYLNGKESGVHEGGYTPFEFDITNNIKKGKNEILVRVMDPVETEKGTEGISYFNIPHGKQNWYIQNSGLWQPAYIILKPENYIRQVHINSAVDGKLEVKINLSKVPDKPEKINVNIFDPSDKKVNSKEFIIDKESSVYSLLISDPLLWDIHSPNLYKIEILYGEDQFTDNFGFRSFEARDGRFYLNGKLFYMIGALDQDFYPGTIYTTPSEDYLRDEMKKAKEIGLNTLRCHIKVPDPLYLKVADELGIIVWYEIPNWDFFSEAAAQRGERTMDEMLARDWNHPSLCVVSIINESWGIDLSKSDQRKWLKEAFDRTKKKFTKGLVVDNSACWGNFHVKTDINDYHTYWTIPENHKQFDKTIADISSRPDWLFSKNGDAVETGKEPILLSEFGNWGLPKLPEKLPWWFSRRFEDIEVSLPEGVHERFEKYKYKEVFGSYNKLAEESQKAQYRALKYEIESIRLSPELQGYIITEFTDINWESNGLLDMWRNHKIYSTDLYNIQQEDVIIPRPQKYNIHSKDTVAIDIWLSHFSNKELNNYKINWKAEDKTGTIPVTEISTGEVKKLIPVKFVIEDVQSPTKVRIDLELLNEAGENAGENYSEVFIYPQSVKKVKNAVIYISPEKNKNTGSFASGPAIKGKTIITNQIDQYIMNTLIEGANIICVVDSSTKVPASFPYKIVSRDSAWLDGNWASNMNWLKNDRPPLRGIAFGKHLGFESVNCRPWRVIQNIPSENYSDVLAGMYIGWVHMTSAYIIQMKAGQGRLILCTIPVLDNMSVDPFSSAMINNMVEYISGNEFNSSTNWNLAERQ